MKRLLCLISGMNTGGAETFLMKIYRSLDKTLYQMDFCINVKEKTYYEDEIVSMGGRIFRIPSKSDSLKEFKKQLSAVIKDNNYRYVMRVTSSAMGFLDLKVAKKAGATVCAVRSSNSSDGKGLKSIMAHLLGQFFYSGYVNVKIAPSDLAAIHTFGKNAYKNREVHILHNAVDLSVYRYTEEGRAKIRNEFNLPENIRVYGHIGRFMQQKNHSFLVDIFEEIHKKEPSSVLMLVGKGEKENLIREKIDMLGLKDYVVFTGVRSDIPELLSAMDAFIFPSFYEGMPNTVIEAQATGLPCVISDSITKEADITGLVNYLPLTEKVEKWAEQAISVITETRKDTKQDFIDSGYEINKVIEDFIKYVFKQENSDAIDTDI